jgi:SAM-dependent methyltransferase
LNSWFAHPSLNGLELDDPNLTLERREIVRSKPFLNNIYCEWYSMLADSLPCMDGGVLELGSGPGFIKEFITDVITSEIFYIPEISLALDGENMPFADQTLRGIVMTDVLHHLPKPRRFFSEAGRCVKQGGVIAMIEPWNTPWSKLLYTWLHHEPFNPQASTWEFPSTGPLSGANGANPWIIFQRDRKIFEQEFPKLHIECIRPMYPLRYLLSGGVSRRNMVPGWSYPFWRKLEDYFDQCSKKSGMFALIIIRSR